MIEIRQILCPIDFSDHSRRALDHAVAIATWFESTVTVLNVDPVVPAASYALGAPSLTVSLPTRLKGLIPDTVRTCSTVDTKLAIGKAYREILRVASDQRTELIVLGAHGRVIAELLFGSTAHQVVRQARAPVLTIR